MSVMKHTTQKEKSETYTLEDVGCYVDSVRGIYAVDAIIQFVPQEWQNAIGD